MKRVIHKIDAEGKVLGRLATKIAILLRGKNKVTFRPHLDEGDFVEVVNFSKVKLTGKKMEQKTYYHHSGYLGGIKTKTPKSSMIKEPEFVLWNAVFHMLPKNKLRSEMIKRLKFIG